MKLIVINSTGRHCYIGHLNHPGISIEPVSKVSEPQQFDLPENLVDYFVRAINTLLPQTTVLQGEEAEAFASALNEPTPVVEPLPIVEQPPVVDPVVEQPPVVDPVVELPPAIDQSTEQPPVVEQQTTEPAPEAEQPQAPAAESKSKKSTRQKQE
ncbi:hypothetical protein A8O28_16890 [Enterobacteriaceae bacterium CCUG 67584]|nr:hypothetical protein [Enterobacteriaceae bacterium CCUG 67584]